METLNPILYTVHGSQLYGLAHEHSDLDTYHVVLCDDKRFIQHTVGGNPTAWDDTVIHLDRFVQQVNKGVPQALEALYSRSATHNTAYLPYLRSLRPDPFTVADTYWRTALNFAVGDFKQKRHAMRLVLNLHDFMRYGSFNPQLTPAEVTFVNRYARLDKREFRVTLQTYLEYALRGVI